MASKAVADAVRAELATVYAGPLAEANTYQLAIQAGVPFLLLQFPPSIHQKINAGQPAEYRETGAFSVRYHIQSGEDTTIAREMIDTLLSHFQGRAIEAGEYHLHFDGDFAQYESEEPLGNWYEMHLAVPYWRQYTKG